MKQKLWMNPNENKLLKHFKHTRKESNRSVFVRRFSRFVVVFIDGHNHIFFPTGWDVPDF